MSQDKIVVGIYSLAGCEGCRHEIVNLGDELLELLKEANIEIAYEPLLGFSQEREQYDIVFVEGAVASKHDIEKLKEIRKKTKILVALGSCSFIGGIPGLARNKSREELEKVYGGRPPVKEPVEPSPITRYVKVDYWLRGCPINNREFVDLVKKLARGEWYKQGERRFEYCKEFALEIKGKLLELDGEKCIVCGRCIGICEKIGIKALGLINRGINIAVSTPFQEPFENTNCILCGLCTAYCPVGAIKHRTTIESVQRLLLRNGGRLVAYMEPEALAALAEVYGVNPGKIIAALKYLGFSEVVLWSPLLNVHPQVGLSIVPVSEAEYRYVNMFYPDLKKYLVKPPEIRVPVNGIVITQCVARKLQSDYILTTREIQYLLKKIEIDELKPAKPDRIVLPESRGYVKAVGPYEVRGILEAIRKGYIKEGTILLYICPDGCIMGGGQPFSKNPVEVCVDCRRRMLEIVRKQYIM